MRSNPLPRSSQIWIILKKEAMASFLEWGAVSIIRFTSTNRHPGLDASTLTSKISIIGPAPRIVRSWWIIIFPSISRTAFSGNILCIWRSPIWISSSCGMRVSIYLQISSKQSAYPCKKTCSRIAFVLPVPLYWITRTAFLFKWENLFKSFANNNAPILVIAYCPLSISRMNSSSFMLYIILLRLLGNGSLINV